MQYDFSKVARFQREFLRFVYIFRKIWQNWELRICETWFFFVSSKNKTQYIVSRSKAVKSYFSKEAEEIYTQ